MVLGMKRYLSIDSTYLLLLISFVFVELYLVSFISGMLTRPRGTRPRPRPKSTRPRPRPRPKGTRPRPRPRPKPQGQGQGRGQNLKAEAKAKTSNVIVVFFNKMLKP